VVDKAEVVQVFSEYFGFPCQPFHRLFQTHLYSSSSSAGTVGDLVASVIVILATTAQQATKITEEPGYTKKEQKE
jgi:hypothetical protein